MRLFERFSNTVQILDFDGVYTSFFSSRCGILETSRATLMLLGWPERESKYIWRNESSFFSAFFVDVEKKSIIWSLRSIIVFLLHSYTVYENRKKMYHYSFESDFKTVKKCDLRNAFFEWFSYSGKILQCNQTYFLSSCIFRIKSGFILTFINQRRRSSPIIICGKKVQKLFGRATDGSCRQQQ